MFVLFLCIAVLISAGSAFVFASQFKGSKLLGSLFIASAIGCVVYAFQTAQGEMVVMQLLASNVKSDWLVIDNSGGETLRHWVLRNAYVQSSERSDGWQFYDDNGNLCYVSGDAFVMKVNTDFDKFLSTYKEVYNIPVDQKPCNQ